MGKELRVLIVEDSDADEELLLAALAAGGYDVSHDRVQTAAEMRTALEQPTWDVVLSDYSLPTFSGPAALKMVKASGRDVPFIIVSGTIGEDAAVSALKSGAHDFLVKGRLARLVPAIERELREVEARRLHARLEDELRQSQKMEAIGQLAGGIAHDFNNLLTAILGYSDLLRDELHDFPNLLADLDEITKAGQSAASLTRQLLAFSRKQLLQPQVLDLNQVVTEIEKMLRRIIGEDVRLETRSTSPSDARVKADPSQIEQVLLNLAVNARDAMPRGGTLSIQTGVASPPGSLLPEGAAAPPNGWVSLAIGDTGTGIAPEVQPRIFEPFFTTKSPGKGTGLGLSTVYGIINQSGGYIGCETHPGAGTTFTIYLPAVRDAVESLTPKAVYESGRGTETILLVEDDTGIRELIRKVLIGRGYTVLDTSNGTEALAVSAHYNGMIHLLLTDIVMPELYGPEVAQLIVARRPNLCVLFVSGFTDRLGIDLGTLSRATSFLHKPFTPDILVQKVRECLDRDRGDARTRTPRLATHVV